MNQGMQSKGQELFGSTKQMLDLLLGFDSDYHRPNKVNYLEP
jgi:hypothetical protein